MKFPHCQHAGRETSGQRFCRHPARPSLVDHDTCLGCHFATPTPPAELQPACPHRGEQIGSIISTTCPRSWQKPVHDCDVHGPCVLTVHNRESVPGVKCCETCPAVRSSPPNPAALDSLAIIAVHFNPRRYCLPLRNYWQWRHHLGPLQRQLFTVELSFDGLFNIHDAIQINGGPQNVMWQKEAMVNAAVAQLPKRYKFVAWIDHDLIFENDTWAEETVAKLSSGFDVVQLFDEWSDTGKHGEETWRRPSRVASLQGHPGSGYPAPGGAWAARRDYFESIGGLPAKNIVGGGDQIACDTWTSTQSHYAERYPALAHYQQPWQKRASSLLQNVGYVPGTVRHLYHGDRKKRFYVERAEILKRHQFDPATDVGVNADGILEWISDKPGLHADIAAYFDARQEDEA